MLDKHPAAMYNTFMTLHMPLDLKPLTAKASDVAKEFLDTGCSYLARRKSGDIRYGYDCFACTKEEAMLLRIMGYELLNGQGIADAWNRKDWVATK